MHHRITYMYINFQQNWVCRSVKPCTLIYLHNIYRKLHKFATTNSIFFILITSDMRTRKTYMYINFQQNWGCRSVKPCTQSYLHNIASCIDLQLPIVIWKKLIMLEMHHYKTYMCINFQQNRVETQVVTVLTSLFAKKLQVA